jgi:hypothetical protein
MISTDKLSREEVAARGDEIYETRIGPNVTDEDMGCYVVIDVESGDYEIDRNELAASDRLRARHPDAQTWLRRVGSRYARHFGARSRSIR